jgi:hypothetical protein
MSRAIRQQANAEYLTNLGTALLKLGASVVEFVRREFAALIAARKSP